MDYYNNETILTQAREIESLRQQLTAALAACEKKDTALQEVVGLISESSGVYDLHLNGDESPWVKQIIKCKRIIKLQEIGQKV